MTFLIDMNLSPRWCDFFIKDGFTRSVEAGTDDVIRRVVDLIAPDARIYTAYLFGSRAARLDGRDSDVDVAFHTETDFGWNDYYLLYGAITKILRSDRVDLVWLNEADALLCFEIIKHGRAIFFRDADALNDFELYAKKRFWDYRTYLEKRGGTGKG